MSVVLYSDDGGYLTKAQEPCLHYYLSVAGVGRKKRWIHAFPKGISTKWNTNSFVQNLNLDFRFHNLRR